LSFHADAYLQLTEVWAALHILDRETGLRRRSACA